jgi:hypothetical protein
MAQSGIDLGTSDVNRHDRHCTDWEEVGATCGRPPGSRVTGSDEAAAHVTSTTPVDGFGCAFRSRGCGFHRMQAGSNTIGGQFLGTSRVFVNFL